MTRTRSILITGTDTGVGKTFICRHLAAYLQSRGLNVITQKWVQTGSNENDDIREHHLALPVSVAQIPHLEELRCPYSFSHPSSPHLAAKIQGVEIKEEKIEQALIALEKYFDVVFVEGSGGALVPLNEKMLMADMAARLGMPVLVVVANKLGAINHTLLTLEALAVRNISVTGLIFNRVENSGDETILSDNMRIIRQFAHMPVLGALPFVTNFKETTSAFEPVGAAFYQIWKKKNE
ncbi:MAG TPA: dethiobiotin synthase [Smithellaceae bacterium]|nr:dethiobiotin synthase [Smithellaceae bacterium]